MSLEIVAKLICDNCKIVVVGKTGNRSTYSGKSYWNAKRQADKLGWVTVGRGRYRKPAHYCPKCADSPVAAIKDPPRKKRCKNCKGRRTVMEWDGGHCTAKVCPVCKGTGEP